MGILTDSLRAAIEQSGKTRAAVAKEAGVDGSVLSRFMTGSSLSLETADKVAEALGMTVSLPRAGTPSRGNGRWNCGCGQANFGTLCTRCKEERP